MDIITYALCDQKINNVTSGFDHAVSNTNADGTVTLTMYWNNGTNTTMTFPKPTGVNNIKIETVDVNGVSEHHLIFTLDDGKTIDAGNIPNLESLTEQEVKDIWQEVLDNK